jgi:hypothetical protein
MRPLPSYAVKWKWCVLPAMAMLLLSLIPQIHLWIVRGREWNGAYVSPQGDEPLYSAYVNALIDGRPRKNDPFGGKDSTSASPLPESTFSIQFIPAYVVTFMARASGVSASTAFIVLIGMAALFASLSVFWLLDCIAADDRLAAAGTLFVLCLGGFAGSYGVFGTFVDIAVPALPFLRRYQPAAVFSLFFIFQVLVWRAFTTQAKRGSQVCAILAGLTLAILVFSYLYLWTAAAAWLVCIGILWFYFRPSERWKTLSVVTTIGVITAIALVPYVYMVSHRAASLDEQQTLILTHRPDLFRVHEMLGALILIALVTGVWRHRFERTERRVIYAASLALLPFVVFNQQVLTGKAMQVFHFEIFVVNYSATLGLLIMATLFWKPIPRRLLTWTAAASFAWGVIVVGLPARVAFVPSAIASDLRIPVLLRLKELSRGDGTIEDLRTTGQTSTLVFSPSVALIRLLPTWTSQGTLLDMGGLDFSGVSRQERKRFFYMHLYYSRAETESLRKALNGFQDDPTMGLYARSVEFGHERVTPALRFDFKPIEPDEIEREVHTYEAYARSFSREETLKRPITYAVIPVAGDFDFTNLDRWYERDAGERVGDYTLYRLKLRN